MLLVSALIAKAQNENTEKIKVGDIMPTFTLVADNGSEVLKSSSLAGESGIGEFLCNLVSSLPKELAAVESKLWPEFKDNANFKLLVIGRDHTNEELKTYNTKRILRFHFTPTKEELFSTPLPAAQFPEVT